MDINDTELEGIDNFYSNESIDKIADAFSEPFEAENISESMFKAAPDMFDDSTFGGFNRTVVGGAVDALDLGMRTIESGVKGSATAINEAKNYVTGQDDDRLKRDILNFFVTAGMGSATSGSMNVQRGINQLIKSGKKDEAAKVILAESDAFKKDNFKQVMAMTAKREPSPVTTSGQRYVPKEASPLEIGTSKFAVEGKLKSNYTTETIKLFDDKLKNIKTAGSPKADELIGTPVKDGTKVGIRKNLNSSTVDGEKGVLQTIHTNNYNGKALSYQPYATVENVTFNVNQKHRQRIASKAKGLAVPEASGKFNMASVDGNYVSNRNLLSEGYDTEISFNPALGHLYTDVTTGQAVKSADTATVIGNRVFANGVTYWKKADAPKPLDASDGTKLTGEVRYKFKRGGLMART